MLNTPTQPCKPSIAAIIPTYNEQENIGTVLKVLHKTESLSEIILVDDGSKDGTVEILRQAAARDRRVHVIQHEKNMGKGQALFTGWAASTAPYILMLDADLKALTPGHLRALIAPVLDHRADMTLGLFWGGHIKTDFSHWFTPFLTGQRGLRAELLKCVSREAAEGYGFEIALTVAAGQNSYRTRVVTLRGVWHPSSEFRTERGGYWNGKIWRFRMYGQIFRAWVIARRERYPKAKAFFSDISKF
jgi:glycosyltransferase involved in cell wall biosynthesis